MSIKSSISQSSAIKIAKAIPFICQEQAVLHALLDALSVLWIHLTLHKRMERWHHPVTLLIVQLEIATSIAIHHKSTSHRGSVRTALMVVQPAPLAIHF